jgi:SAM-dependent methyltransferase
MHEGERWEERYRQREGQAILPPSSFLRDCIDKLPRGRALDVACGDGRHALFLARHGFRVDAIDRSYAALEKARSLARSEDLSTQFVQADLESYPLPKRRYLLVVNIRYLDRSRWAALKESLRPDGRIIVETFLREQQRFGHPRNPAFLLEPGELRSAFQEFEILSYEEGLFESETGPAFLARMLARKPPQSLD